MTYRRTLIGRWSRRDRLAVIVVAVGVAFICGTALLVTVAGSQVTEVAAEYGTGSTVITHDTVRAAERAAPADATVLPFAVVTGPEGARRFVLARPSDPGGVLGMPDSRAGVTLGTVDTERREELTGDEATVSVRVSPRGDAVVSARWYVADRATVEQLGASGAFVLRPVPEGEVPLVGVPLRTALAFFVLGTREALAALATVVAGAGALVGVVVYSVTRMTVRDRRLAVSVIRATGGTGRAVVGLFAARAGLLTATGALLGYAIGIIGVNAAINAAVFAGLPTTLSPRVTAEAARVIIPVLIVVTLLGTLGGALAAFPAARRPPFAGDEPVSAHPRNTDTTGATSRLRSLLTPTLLDPRALIPTAMTLTAFVAFAVLVVAMSGVVVPLSGGEGATITEPGAVHPVASTVPETYADALQARGIDASAEVLLFEAFDGQPYIVRGANYSAFRSVSDVSLIAGRRPASPDEAVIGEDLARTLNVDRGEYLTLGGLTRPGLTRVRVVGVFRGSGLDDDQLLIPLSTARDLTSKPPGTVQFVRADRLPDTDEFGSTAANESGVGSRMNGSGSPDDGDGSLVVGPLPKRGPSNATLFVPVRYPNGTTVVNATVTVGGRTVETGSDGTARVSTGDPGRLSIVASKSGRSTRTSVLIIDDAVRTPVVELSVSPDKPDLLTTPTVTVQLSNPWDRALTNETITIAGPGRTSTQTVTLKPGERRTLSVQLPRQAPGQYDVSVTLGEQNLATMRYTVTGDERVAAALATGGRSGTSGIGRAVETAFGNLQVVFVVVFSLAAALTVGGTTATFARAVHGRRETIGVYRATGASPEQVAQIVLADATRIGAGAALLAVPAGLIGLQLIAAAGYLTVFGVRLRPTASPELLVGVAVAALALSTLGAGLAVASLLRITPSGLLGDAPILTPDTEGDQ